MLSMFLQTTPGSIPSAAKDRFTRRRSSISVAEDANLYVSAPYSSSPVSLPHLYFHLQEVLRQSSAEIRDHLVGLEKATHDVDLVLQAKASVTRALTNQHSSKLEELTQAKQALVRGGITLTRCKGCTSVYLSIVALLRQGGRGS